MNVDTLTFSRDLTEDIAASRWPDGVRRLPFDRGTAALGHAILAKAYRNGFGAVGAFEDWHAALVADAEYDWELCFLYCRGDRPAAFAQVWSSGFIKDLAVEAGFRRHGLGTALLRSVFIALQARNLTRARLKVFAANDGAISLYRKCGMQVEP